MTEDRSYTLEVVWDRPEERKALITKLRSMLPAPKSVVRKTADDVGQGLLEVMRPGLSIYGHPDEPIDYAPDSHFLFLLHERYVNQREIWLQAFKSMKNIDLHEKEISFSIATFLLDANPVPTKKVRCPNCGATIMRVPSNIMENDLLMVACENTHNYKFAKRVEGTDQFETNTDNPHGPLVFEYRVSEWL